MMPAQRAATPTGKPIAGAEGLVLCKFSRSEILSDQVLRACPLRLKHAEHPHCPCKRRKYNVTQYDLRVSECLYPHTFQNEVIRSPEAFRAKLVQSIESRKAREKEGKPSMTTAVAEPKANGVQRTAEKKGEERAAQQPVQQPVQVADDRGGLWSGIQIPIMGVCGEKGEGKTLMVSSIDPEGTGMIDLEDSSASYNIPFKKRWNLYEEMIQRHNRVPTPLECFEWFRDLITNHIKPGEFSVLAVDPISDIEQGMVDWVQANPQHFGHTKAQYDKAAGLMWGDVKSYWKILLGTASKKVETFAFTVHMGAVWKGSQPVEGKRKPKGKETLFELASLYLQMERPLSDEGKKTDKPSARVLKSRLAHSRIVDGEVIHTPILPPYLKVATPKSIRDYIKSPPDYAKLKKSEYAPPEKMSEEDKLLIEAEIAENNRVAEETRLTRMEQMKKAAEEQMRLKQQREDQHAAAAAKAEAGTGTGAGDEQAPFATGSASNDQPPTGSKQDYLADLKATGDRGELDRLHREVNGLMSALQMNARDMDKALAKRGVKTVEELDAAKAEDLRGKLQKVLNDRQAAAKATSGN